ncbi:MAG: hypothetical protein CMN76_12470 [Spirochaetaceae bacterium]|nr:hypothetical protein [Spirochaetaceae bacterium]|tara:strand:- start:62213 stop:62713 length:501 start_codon:yes stop_codon:yes gene_type:complete
MDKEQVIELIQSAFDGVPQPDKLTLHVAEAHDNWDYDNDAIHWKKDHKGPWQDVPDDHLEECQFALSYLDPVGFRYYLPAFMVWYLRNYSHPGRVPLDNALYALERSVHEPKRKEFDDKKYSLFSEEQLRACAAFVRLLAEDTSGMTDEDFAERAYYKYWHQFDVY